MKKIISILLVGMIALCCVACGNNNDNTEISTDNIDNISTKNEANTYKGVEMSDELYDFTIKIDGIVYTVPSKLSDFLNSGWDYAYDNPEENSVNGEDSEFDKFENKNGLLGFSVINLSGNTKKFKDCKIGGLDYSFSEWNNCSIELAKGLVLDKTKTTSQDVIDKWGKPTENRTSEYGKMLDYIKDDNVMYHFSFDENDKLITFEAKNWVADANDITTNAERPAYLDNYKVPTSLTNNFLSYTFKLDGAFYTFPAPVSEFVKNGWKITEKVESVAAKQGISNGITIEKNGNKLTCGIRNYSDSQVSAEDTMITRMYITSYYDDVGLELSGGIKLGMSETDFKKIINVNDFDRHVYENTGTINYDLTEYTHHAYFEFSKDGILKSINFGKEVLD